MCYRLVHSPALDEPESIPYLIAEVASLLAQCFVEEDVVACRGREHHPHADSVSAEFVDEIQRIRRVAQRLGHLASYLVTDNAGEIDILKRFVAHVLIACHNHPRHPEEDDVRAGHEVGGRIIVAYLFVARIVYAVKECNRP